MEDVARVLKFSLHQRLELGKTYYWKVNEAEIPPIWEGQVQSFSTAAYVIVDDMESYKSEDGKWIWETWTDGKASKYLIGGKSQ